jgi:hypothetical protein
MNEPTKAIQYLIDTAPLYAKAKADRMYLEEFRKSRKAQLMSQAGTEVLGKQEVYAYAHADYVGILEGIREVWFEGRNVIGLFSDEQFKEMECEAAMRFQHHKLNYKTEDV